MAYFNQITKSLVLKVVYTGFMGAGKTTTLEKLNNILYGDKTKNNLFSVEKTWGKTGYFEWLDYTGGIYQGHTIQCQIITIDWYSNLTQRYPSSLRQRYPLIFKDADVIVFVTDITKQDELNLLESSLPLTDKLLGSIIIQANKIDKLQDPDPVIEKIQNHLKKTLDYKVVFSNALTGEGIRETFVKSIGIALERVKKRSEKELLIMPDNLITTSQDLLNTIEEIEAETDFLLITKIKIPPKDKIEDLYWVSPTEKALFDLLAEKTIGIYKAKNNILAGHFISWKFQSNEIDCYETLTTAQAALAKYMDIYLKMDKNLSKRRGLILLKENNNWRLWQVIYIEINLERLLGIVLKQKDKEAVAYKILAITQYLLKAFKLFANNPFCTKFSLSNIAYLDNQLCFIGSLNINNIEEQKKLISSQEIVETYMVNILSQIVKYYKIEGAEIMIEITRLATSSLNDDVICALSIALLPTD